MSEAEVVEVRAPVENVNDDTIAIVRWLVENGAFVETGDPLVLAETSKTVFDVPAPARGFVWQVAQAGTDIPTGGVLGYVGVALDAVKAAAASEPVSSGHHSLAVPHVGQSEPLAAAEPQAPSEIPPTRFSAKAAALIEEFGFDPVVFAGKGMVRERDVLFYRSQGASGPLAAAAPAQPTASAAAARPVPAASVAALGVPTRAEKLSRTKRAEIRHLRASWAGTLPSLAAVAVPTSGFWTAAQHGQTDPGLASAAAIFETARLLRQYAFFNAYYADDVAHYYEDVNIGYAIDLDKGLKVPVIRHADRKSLNEIAAEKQQYLVDYINDALSLEALTGGTFTISDLSSEGVVHFQPMINEGQSAILGICAETFSPPSGAAAYNLVLAFDHQLADGRSAASFLRDLRDRLTAHEATLRPTAETAVAPTLAQCAICLRPASELESNRHFLVRTVGHASGAEQAICTICLQDW